MGKREKSGSAEKDIGPRPEGFEAKLDFIFDSLQKPASGIGDTDPSLRETMPDIGGIIEGTAKKLHQSEIIGMDGEDLSGPRFSDDEDTQAEAFTEERPTLPPRSNYGLYIEQTTDNKNDQTLKSEGENGPDDVKSALPITEVPDEIDLEQLLKEAFGDEFPPEEYVSTARGERLISQPPLPDLSEEESLLTAETLPEIEIDEATLEEQLLLDERYSEIGRILSFFTENGIETRELLDMVNSFANNYKKMLGPEEISDLLVILFRHLTNSLLVRLEKRHKHSCEAAEKFSGILFESQKLNERKNDKALVLSLRIMGKMCDLYEMKRDGIEKKLYREFADGYLGK